MIKAVTDIRRCFLNLCSILIVSVLLMSGLFADSTARAELIPAVEEVSSQNLRGMIEDGSVCCDQLMSWVAFDEASGVAAMQSVSIFELQPFGGDDPNHQFDFGPRMVADIGCESGCTSTTSNAGGSTWWAQSAIVTPRALMPDPVLLRFWRGSEFVFIPDAPSSGLFRPPRLLISL